MTAVRVDPRLYSPVPAAAEGPLRFAAMSGMAAPETGGRGTVNVDLIDLSRFHANPVVCWNHDLGRLPVGRGAAFADGDRLLVDVVFDRGDGFAAEVERKYRAGFLHAVSVDLKRGRELCVDADGNFDPARQRWVLYEVSCCVVPVDAFATVVRPEGNGHGGAS